MAIDTGARGKRAASRIAPTSRRSSSSRAARSYRRTSISDSSQRINLSPTLSTSQRIASVGPNRKQKITSALARVMKAYRSSPSAKGLDIPASIARLDVNIGRKSGIPPSVLAAQQRQESGFNPAAVSSAGAYGISQFMPGTASEYKVQQGTSKSAVKSQVKGQAAYLNNLGFKQDPQKALSGYSGGYSAGAYNNPILQGAKDYKQLDKPGKKPKPKDVHTLQKAGIATHGSAPHKKPAAAKRYVNPIPSKAWTQSRTDEGVDFAPKTANAPIRALGDATYIGKGQGPGWADGGGGGNGDGIVYKLKNAKGLPSSYIFAYEGLKSDPNLRPGQKIKKGQIIGQTYGPGTSIEIGYASGPDGAPVNQSTYSEGQVTRGGTQFQNLLAKLPGSSATKGNIGSFVSSGGGGASGAAGFSSVTGISAKVARKMTPTQRIAALKRAIARATAGYSSSSSSPSTGTGSLGSKYGHPAV